MSSATPNVTLDLLAQYPSIPAGMPDTNPYYLSARLVAPDYEPEDGEKRSSLDIMCVVDRSGSMDGRPLEEVKRTLDFLVTQMKDTDRLGIITYDHRCEVHTKLTEMTSGAKSEIRERVTKIRTGGSTNICSALVMALNKMADRSNPREVGAILLLTDGQANDGARTGPEFWAEIAKVFPPAARRKSLVEKSLVEKLKDGVKRLSLSKSPPVPTPPTMEGLEKLNLPCVVHSFGFSSGHNAKLMRELCELGALQGSYYFIESADDIADSFGNALGGLQTTIGRNLKVHVQVHPSWATIAKVHTRNAVSTVKAGRVMEITVGDIQAEETKDILVELKVTPVSDPVDKPELLVTASFEGENIVTGKKDSGEKKMSVPRPKGKEHAGEPLEELEEQVNRVIAAQATQEAVALSNAGNYAQAQSHIETAMTKMKKSKVASGKATTSLLEDMVEAQAGMASADAYVGGGHHYSENMVQTHWMQRGARAHKSAYKGKKKSAMESAGRSHVAYSGGSSSKRS